MKNQGPATVAVILSRADLKRASNLRVQPDYFELRLDALAPTVATLRRKFERLNAPIIITARHPSEGGVNRLSPKAREALLRQFIPNAQFIDVELRSVHRFANLLKIARSRSIGIIVSLHDLTGTPSARQLDAMARTAGKFNPDIVKLATRTDNPMQFARLRDFFERHRGRRRIAVMGIGKLGLRFRKEVAKTSAFNYVHLGEGPIDGQLSIFQLRRFLKRENASKSRLPIYHGKYS
jgi:3-dehydroquinate dehydratase-1